MTEERNESSSNKLEEGTASFTDEEFARFERIMQRIGHAAVPAIAVPIGASPVQPANLGMSMPFTMPELRG